MAKELTLIEVNHEKKLAGYIADYEQRSGRTLSPADPLFHVFGTVAFAACQEEESVNYTFRQVFLSEASGTGLDFHGDELTERLPVAPAVTTLRFTLSQPLEFDVVVTVGTRATAGSLYVFATDQTLIIYAGSTYGDVTATCLTVGEFANGLVPGQIKTLADPQAGDGYVASVANITTTNSGADEESDDAYRERIRLAPESLSVGGPRDAYVYHALSTHQSIVDVNIVIDTPGTVQIYPLIEGGELPTDEIKELVLSVCGAEKVRPLTDTVLVLSPEQVSYDIEFTYYISEVSAALQSIIADQVVTAVNEFVTWQYAKLGRNINTSKLISMVMEAGASRVSLTQPDFLDISASQVAICGTKTILYGGVESD